ncbi:hypothetical protein GCM10015535_12390 [Streptomyces gelaticus]|uniref:DUF3068 domain-containing protein n=1 Tax=Streptomyces gelaticus TaxID=285446 RepID=A0ABQ2VTC9_9ACTN|nr:hypothetical protein GCM10015535_12390 [Streptomyces gelaticus]
MSTRSGSTSRSASLPGTGAIRSSALSNQLRLRFASERLVYPMRLSKLASTPQQLGLYVLAAHRMEPSGPIGGEAPEVTYAGRIDPRSVADDTVHLERLTGGKPVYLTAIEQSFPHPERIDGDHELRAADADTPYRRQVYRNELLTVGGVPVWVLSLLTAVLTVVAVLLVLWSRRQRRVPPAAGAAGAAGAPGMR